MNNSLRFTEADIRAAASGQSFDRGHSYYRSGAVLDVVRRGNVVTADVEGSEYEPYQVQVWLRDGMISSAGCTCPYSQGGYCKHIVATLLTVLHKPDEVEEKTELATLLAELTAAQLRALIINVAEAHPEVADTIEQEVELLPESPATPGVSSVKKAPLVDENAIRREIRKDFRLAGSPGGRQRDYYDYYDDDEGAEIDPELILGPHLKKVRALLDAGDAEAAADVISTIIDEWIEGLTDLEEWIYEYNEETFGEAALLLGATLAEVLLSLELTAEEREEWLESIAEWEEGLGDVDIATTAIEQGWAYPPLVAAMQGHVTDKGAWEGESPDYADELALARLRILERQGRNEEYIYLAEAEGQVSLAVNMLARTGQTAKAVADAKQYLGYPAEVHSLATYLAATGEMEAALDVGEFGLGLEQKMGKTELATWLRDQAEQSGRPALALTAAEATFASSHSLADYQATQRLAGEAWPEVKPRLLESLKTGWVTNKINVYLYENMLPAAMQALDKEGFYYDNELQRVIEATREKYPDWGIARCKKQAEQIMDAGKAQAYDSAASWLTIAHGIYEQHNRLPEWNTYLKSILEKHQRKYKLVPLLRNIR